RRTAARPAVWRSAGPLAGAALAAAAAVGALFFLLGREAATPGAPAPAHGLSPGQIVAPVALAAPSVTPPAPMPEPVAPRPTMVATAMGTVRARPAARPVRIDVPALASTAATSPPPERELAAAPAPPAPAALQAAPAATYTPPAPPPVDAPFVHHLPD